MHFRCIVKFHPKTQSLSLSVSQFPFHAFHSNCQMCCASDVVSSRGCEDTELLLALLGLVVCGRVSAESGDMKQYNAEQAFIVIFIHLYYTVNHTLIKWKNVLISLRVSDSYFFLCLHISE